jgi:2'-5' RNA ligase
MIRTFLAVELQPALRDAIDSCQRDLRRCLEKERAKAVRMAWVHPSAIHLTMKFLGDTDEGLVAPLREAVARAVVSREAGTLPIERLGAFPRPQAPRILWVGPSEEWARGSEARGISALQHHVEEACAEFGFLREAKPFNPHLTLVRIKEGERHVGNELARSGVMDSPLAVGSLAVDAIVLMKSDLRPTGPVYTRLWDVTIPARSGGAGSDR